LIWLSACLLSKARNRIDFAQERAVGLNFIASNSVASFAVKLRRVAALPTLSPPSQTQINAPAPLRLWHLTSLDAPTVAVVWCLGFAWAVRIALPLWLPVVLALAGWSFYILDRLLDARRCLTHRKDAQFPGFSPTLLRARHYFHWKHRRIFAPIAIVAAVVAVGLVWHSMPVAARARNSVLAAAAMAYFTSVHSPWRVSSRRASSWRLPKELLVGILFTLPCSVPVWSRMAAGREALVAPILVYMALAWLNCVAIETWESGERTSIFRVALGLAAVAVAAAALCFALHWPRVALLLASAALSAGLLATLDRMRGKLGAATLRATADLVLLTPLALLILP